MDVPKHNAARSYQQSDGRTSCDVADIASSWSAGAEIDPSLAINEAHELDQKHGIETQTMLSDLYAGNTASNTTLPNPHNKRGPKTGANAPFDAADYDGDSNWQSYADDPPISNQGPMMGSTPAQGVFPTHGSGGRSLQPHTPHRHAVGRETRGGTVSGSTVSKSHGPHTPTLPKGGPVGPQAPMTNQMQSDLGPQVQTSGYSG